MKRQILGYIILAIILTSSYATEPKYSWSISINTIKAWGFGGEITTYATIRYVGFGVYYNKAYNTDYQALSIVINQGFNLPFYKSLSLELANLTGISILPKAKTLAQHLETNVGFAYDKGNWRFAFYIVTMLDPYNNKMDFNNCWTFRLKFIKFF